MTVQWLLSVWAWPLLFVGAVACAVWAHRIYARTEPAPPPRARRLLIGLRTLACWLALLAIARPLVVKLQDQREPAVVAIVVEDSASMGLETRWQDAWQLAARVDSTLTALPARPEVIHLRGNGRAPARRTAPAEAEAEPPVAVGTDLSGLVAQARQRLLGRPLRAMIVLSDGHSDEPAATTGQPGLPLSLVGIGEVTGPPDRFLASLRYPDRVQRGQPVIVEVAVAQQDVAFGSPGSPGSPGQPLTVRLLHEGEVVAEQESPAADLVRMELQWTPQEAGLAVLEVEVAALVNERYLANNKATLAVNVQQDQARVLVLAAAPGWDVRFLAQAALLEPRLALEVVRPGPAGPVLADSMTAWQAPPEPAAWRERWDAVVLAGPPAMLLPDGGLQLAAAVRDGLGLVAIAGDPASDVMPRSWPGALQAVLPVVLIGDQPRHGEHSVRAGAGAPRHAVTAGITHGTGAGGALAGWPPLRRVQPVRPQPAAEVLLDAGADRPLLAVMNVESGRSLWFGGRRLWDLVFWRLPGREAAGGESAGQLLRQMLLWAALGDQTAGIALLGQRVVYEEGETVPVAARWLDLRGEPVAGRPAGVEVVAPDGGPQRVVALAPDARRPGVAVGDLPPLPPGRWRLVPRSLDEPAEIGPAREIVITRAERELAQVRQDRRSLRQVAARLGGVALDGGQPDQVQRLLAGLPDLDLTAAATVRQARLEPAAGWPWLLAAVVLLTGEWLLRRRHGLL